MVDLQTLYRIFLKHPEITTDSRKIIKNAIFFALKGERFDGNEYAGQALKDGCAYAVIDNPAFFTGNQHLILVTNVLKTLQNLARYHRQQFEIPVLAITGTNGKTTTKELITRILQKSFRVVATSGNLNNHIGVPLTLLKATADTEFIVVEMGANHPGEIAALCDLAMPVSGMITNIGKAHLEGFGNIQNVAHAKAELFHYLRKNKGTIFYNRDNPRLKSLIHPDDRSVTYGTMNYPGNKFTGPADNPFLSFIWHAKTGDLEVKTKMYGRYNFENFMAAISVGVFYGIRPQKIIEAVESYVPDNARSQIIETGKNHVILDAYNANPSSVELALREFLTLTNDPKAIILGDMFELGRNEEEEHRRILNLLLNQCTHGEKVIVIGKVFNSLAGNTPFSHFPDNESAKEYFDINPLHGYSILIKGSRGMAMESLLPLF
ncbi:MAG: UDP-N-acetylmuramoyl-tripeptide--D-alanyl-D-alanine ligase [Chlorobi bacterium]|nr:UDP-N-acetylmuramoyl-tripeptide--D-alanyl-D-alanine ligase [Chlorobiota bacterium]